MNKSRFTLADIEKIFNETIFNITVLNEILDEFRELLNNLTLQSDTGVDVGNLNLSMTTQFNKLFLEYNRQVIGLKEIIEFHKNHMMRTMHDHIEIMNNRTGSVKSIVNTVYMAHKTIKAHKGKTIAEMSDDENHRAIFDDTDSVDEASEENKLTKSVFEELNADNPLSPSPKAIGDDNDSESNKS